MQHKYIYIVFSSTPYKMGRFIRTITHQTYNHISVSLDESLKQMYGFARRYYHTPFYGGFVHESVSRYHIGENTTDIRLCRIPISENRFRALSSRIQAMQARQDHYLYNHLSAVSSLIHKRIPVKDAYMCVEFIVDILHRAGINIEQEKYYSVQDIEQLLLPYSIYTGPIPETDVFDTTFYACKPIPHPIITSFFCFAKLFARIGK